MVVYQVSDNGGQEINKTLSRSLYSNSIYAYSCVIQTK